MQTIDSAMPILVTMGCPSGVGPEIALRAVLQARQKGLDCRIVGDRGTLAAAASRLDLDVDRIVGHRTHDDNSNLPIPILEPVAPLHADERKPGRPSMAGGAAQLTWIDFATDWVLARKAAALVTGPVSKEVIATSGAPGADSFKGHTEHIARRIGQGTPVMVFVADSFAVSLVTTHLPLRDVSSCLTIESTSHATRQTVVLLARLGCQPARVLICALNPHAGEGGMLGDEEMNVIEPAVQDAKAWVKQQGFEAIVDGPCPAESAFRIAMGGRYDGVVAMYHDQGTIPMKLRYFGHAVNVTAGLPIIRTSVDHGTAYDIAGQGKADAGSLWEAIHLADRLSQGRSKSHD